MLLERLHQLLRRLHDHARSGSYDGDEVVNGRGRIPSQSRMGPYERLKSEISSQGFNKTRGKKRD